MEKCLLDHDFSGQSSSGSSSSKSSLSSGVIEIIDPIDVISRSNSRSPSIEEIPMPRPGNFEDFWLREPQEPSFLLNPVSGNEVIVVEDTPEIIEIFVEDQPSTSTGRRHGQGPPTGKPQACLKKKSKEEGGGSAPKKQKIYNIGKSNF